MNKAAIYVVPDVSKVSGGPRTRISLFTKVFEKNGSDVIMGEHKFLKSRKTKKLQLLYIESATNRISLTDFFSILILTTKARHRIVFIRDVYIEMFPEEFKTLRKKITGFFNKLSYRFLTQVATKLAFPTKEMGDRFYKSHKSFPIRPYFALPPGTSGDAAKSSMVDFDKKIGVLYLGGISYINSGFEHFLNFSRAYQDQYSFYVLSGDHTVRAILEDFPHITLDVKSREQIQPYLEENNIAFAFHSRPRNEYDDLTFPIKAMDFLSWPLPFLTADHMPITGLLGSDYPLFVDVSYHASIHKKIQKFASRENYSSICDFLKEVCSLNTYDHRYKELMGTISKT